MEIKSGDKICQGRYVWKCKDTVDTDWCNIYSVESEFVFLAWQLIDAYPDPIVLAPIAPASNSTVSNTTKYQEPSDEFLLAHMDSFALLKDFEQLETYILPISIDEVWDNFYADVSLFYSNEGFIEALGNYTNWHEPADYYKDFEGLPVLQQRDMEVTVNLPPNPILRVVNAQKHFLLLSKTNTTMLLGLNVGQSGFPYADAAE
jgi:hypothetical protein